MKTRAAVAFEAGKPLEVCEVDLRARKRVRFSLKSRQPAFVTRTNLPVQVRTRKVFSRPSLAMREPVSWLMWDPVSQV